jgi:Ca2+/H+ antiporter, TMEM165/GDT1 family
MFVPGLIQNAAAVGAAFSASLVECVEALTIVLAVSSVSGWRSGLLGASGGAVFLAATVALAGGALIRVPLNDLHVLVGLVLLAFGLSWLRKAVLRTAGMKAQRDEAAIYSRHIDQMRSNLHAGFGRGLDFLAMTAAFKAVVIEGIEVVFIVVTVGRMAGALIPAALGATAAAIAIVALGLVVHRPLTRVPENALKFGVGVIIVSFGVFWLGEGLGLAWPGGDLSIVAIIAGVFALAHSFAASFRLQHRRTRHDAHGKPRASVAGGSREVSREDIIECSVGHFRKADPQFSHQGARAVKSSRMPH